MLNDILKDKTALFKDGVRTVLRGQENRTRGVGIIKGNLVSNSRSEIRGISAAVCDGAASGFASVSEYSGEAAEEALGAAVENAAFLRERGPRDAKQLPLLGRGYIPLNRPVIDCEQERIIAAAREIDGHIEKAYPDLKSRRVVYREDSQDKIIYSSDGFSGHVTSPRCYIYVFLSAESKEGVPVELFKTFGGAGSFEDNFSDLGYIYPEIDMLYEQLMDKREGVFAEAGYKTVVLGGYMTGMLAHEAVGHTVEADLVLGGSVASKLLGAKVASDLVNMTDFANLALGSDAPLPIYLDDEGVKAEDAVLIENGVLKGYMHNRESAEHFGVPPAGNARAWIFSDEPLIRMRNTAVLPGKDRLEDMIASVDDGYYLLNSTNGQADLTGEFMFGVSMGYEIKKGKLGRALLDTTVSGVAFDMLKTVDMVSDEVIWSSSGFCGKKQRIPVGMGGPQLRCKMMIGGR